MLMRHALLLSTWMLLWMSAGFAQRKWERSLQPFEISAMPEGQIPSGAERLAREITMAGRIGVAAGGPFIAFSAGWDEPGVATANSSLRISTSFDSLTWTPWMEVPIDPHSLQTRWQACTELAFLPAGTRFYRLQVLSNQLGQGRLMKRIQLNFFDPGPRPTTTAPSTQEVTSTSGCPCDKPAVITRAGWNCPQTNNPGYAFTTVTHLIVHHSAGSNTSSDWPAVVLSIWNSHVNTNGWADIGYNYLIDPQGRLYEGRGGGDNVTGAHFCGTNGGTMGTCILGTYTSTSMPDTARKVLTRLLAWKACGSSINPIGNSWHASSSRNLSHISGHRDGCATECPGQRTYNELPALRTAVADQIAACNTTTSLPQIPGLQQFRFTPNPVRHGKALASFDLATPKRLLYEVYTADGRLLYASPSRSIQGTTSIDIKGLDRSAKGSAYIVFRLDKSSFVQRVLVE